MATLLGINGVGKLKVTLFTFPQGITHDWVIGMPDPEQPLTTRILQNPVSIRVLPFAVILGLTAVQGMFGGSWPFWLYLIKTVVSAGVLLWVWKHIPEVRWSISIPAVSMGIVVFVLWVGLHGKYPSLPFLGSSKPATPWNPHLVFGEDSPLAWFFVAVRIVGSSLVVPAIEEIFYRSFLYRFITTSNIEEQSLRTYVSRAFYVGAVLFGIAHAEWLPGILCGMAYQWLVLRRGHLGDAVTAHAITNLLLGLWVAFRGAWQFW